MTFPAKRPLAYLITKGEATAENFETASRQIIDIATLAVSLEVDLIQIREKDLTARLLFELTRRVVEITRGSATKVLVNDRFDIAIAAGADGVHLPSNSIRAEIARANTPDGFLIGVSTHNLNEIERARKFADFVVFGPMFDSPGKDAGVGVEKLKDVCAQVSPFPVLALGGIDETNCNSVVDAGASGFAAIRALNDASSLEDLMDDLRNK